MKLTTFILLPFILFVFSANSTPSPVLDTFGKPLRTGALYYIMPAAMDGADGGLFMAEPLNISCPTVVVQSRNDENGIPLAFTPVNPKKGVVRIDTDLNIKFSSPTTSHHSNVWKIGYDKAMKQYGVMVGGVEGNPGQKTVNNWFKIQKFADGYKLVFCPSVCRLCNVMCKDIGISVDENGAKRLVLTDDTASFVFFQVYSV